MSLYWIWFALLEGISHLQKIKLLERISDPEEIFHRQDFSDISWLTEDMAEALTNKDLSRAQQVLRNCAEKQIGVLTMSDMAYPTQLRNIDEPPFVLYYKGVFPDFAANPVVGVVGTRKASAYGIDTARKMAQQITACGGLVVSGGAAGVDTAALVGALEVGGKGVAVLGCGVDVVYPKSNKRLFEQISQSGCLVSEYQPGVDVKPWQFPRRNRIISGLSNGVLVVEAPEKSGALITARNALEQGRDVFVVPGNIDFPGCAGSNQMLRDGAVAVFSGWDIMQDYAAQYPQCVAKNTPVIRKELPEADQTGYAKIKDTVLQKPSGENKKFIDIPKNKPYSVLDDPNASFTEQERKIIQCLSQTPILVDELMEQVDLPAAQVLRIMTKLAMSGVVIHHPGGLVSVK